MSGIVWISIHRLREEPDGNYYDVWDSGDISIHRLREEPDRRVRTSYIRNRNFNPQAP